MPPLPVKVVGNSLGGGGSHPVPLDETADRKVSVRATLRFD
jgi:hypothetical protein